MPVSVRVCVCNRSLPDERKEISLSLTGACLLTLSLSFWLECMRPTERLNTVHAFCLTCAFLAMFPEHPARFESIGFNLNRRLDWHSPYTVGKTRDFWENPQQCGLNSDMPYSTTGALGTADSTGSKQHLVTARVYVPFAVRICTLRTSPSLPG